MRSMMSICENAEHRFLGLRNICTKLVTETLIECLLILSSHKM